MDPWDSPLCPTALSVPFACLHPPDFAHGCTDKRFFPLPSVSPGGICTLNLFVFSWISQTFPGVFSVAHFPEMLFSGDFSTQFLNCKQQRAKGTGFGVFCTQNYHLSPALLLSCVNSKNQTDWSLMLGARYPSRFPFTHPCLCITKQSPFPPVLPSPLRCATFCYIWQPRRSLEPLLNREIPIPLNTNNCAFFTHCCHQMFELSCLEQPGSFNSL